MQSEVMEYEKVGTDTIHPEFVPVLFAKEMEHARRVKQLLEDNNIPAMLDHDLDGEAAYTVLPRGIGVLVPDLMHTIASEIVASDEYDDIDDDEDNCPAADNLDQADADGDGIGDVCDADPGLLGSGPEEGVYSGPPTAEDDLFTLDADGRAVVEAPGVLENDIGGGLTAKVEDKPAEGKLTFDADGSFTYEAPKDPSPRVTFTYRVVDGAGDAVTATVTIARDEASAVPSAPATPWYRRYAVPIAAALGAAALLLVALLVARRRTRNRDEAATAGSPEPDPPPTTEVPTWAAAPPATAHPAPELRSSVAPRERSMPPPIPGIPPAAASPGIRSSMKPRTPEPPTPDERLDPPKGGIRSTMRPRRRSPDP